jgi:hypothetical protein
MQNLAEQTDPMVELDNHVDDTINKLGRFIKTKKQHQKIITKTINRTVTITEIIKELNHEIVTYNDKKYIVGCLPCNKRYLMFIADADNKDKIIKTSWHFATNGKYVATQYEIDSIRKELYMHNMLMDKLTFEGKGQQQTVDHINRIGTDNRKINLRLVESQSAQNFNQKRRPRKIILPDSCGITANELPKNINYYKPDKTHGDCFTIEIKGVPTLGNSNYFWRTSRSKNITLKLKLEEALDQLKTLKNDYPELKDVIICKETDDKRQQLINEYNDILKLSHYSNDIIQQNLRDFTAEYVKINNEEAEHINVINNTSVNVNINDIINDKSNIVNININDIIHNNVGADTLDDTNINNMGMIDLECIVSKKKITKPKSNGIKNDISKKIDVIENINNQVKSNSDDIKNDISKKIDVVENINQVKSNSNNIKNDISKKLDVIENINNQIKPKPNITSQLDQQKILRKLGRRKDNLPQNCGVKLEDLPHYSYFVPESSKRGCKFVIDRHPSFIKDGTRQWSTSGQKGISVANKFNELKKKMKELDDKMNEN